MQTDTSLPSPLVLDLVTTTATVALVHWCEMHAQELSLGASQGFQGGVSPIVKNTITHLLPAELAKSINSSLCDLPRFKRRSVYSGLKRWCLLKLIKM